MVLQKGSDKGANSLGARVMLRNAYSSVSNADSESNEAGALVATAAVPNGFASHKANGADGIHHANTTMY